MAARLMLDAVAERRSCCVRVRGRESLARSVRGQRALVPMKFLPTHCSTARSPDELQIKGRTSLPHRR